MSVKSWLQKNQVYDKDLVTIFPKYGINNPEKDLKDLTPQNWKKIQAQLKKDRSKELKDNAAKLRMQKKLTKIEKLWKAKRPKKKTKAPKLIPLFADDNPPTNEPNGSPTKKKNKNKKKRSPSPKKREQNKNIQSKVEQNGAKKDDNTKEANPTDETKNDTVSKDSNDNKVNKDNNIKDNNETTEENEWKYDHVLNISDGEEEQKDNNTLTIPTLPTHGSVVDMLLNIGNNNEPKKEEVIQINVANVVNDNDTKEEEEEKDEWHYDDALKLSDDEEEQEEKPNDTAALIIPMFKLKTQGSVVDMLMTGPYDASKIKKPVNNMISVTPPEPSNDTIEKDYSITVSFNGDTKEATDSKQTNKIDDKIKENKERSEDKKEENINNSGDNKLKVSLNADNFMYNESTKTYSISLSGCKLMKSDFMNGTITFEINKDLINVTESDKVLDDKDIDKMLDEIHGNNPDTETED